MLRAAVVGMKHPHAPAWIKTLEVLEERGSLELVAFYDSDGSFSGKRDERLRNRPFYTELAPMLRNERLDVALVTPWTNETPDLMVELAKAQVHMLVDKPMARDVREARKAVDAARTNGVRVAVGFCNRLNPAIQQLRKLIGEGVLGRILAFEAHHISPIVELMPGRASNPLYSKELSGGGHLHWLGIHYLDLMMYLAQDEITQVMAMTPTLTTEPISVEDVAIVGVRFRSGAVGSLHSGNLHSRSEVDQYFAVRGERGTAIVHFNGAGRKGTLQRLQLWVRGDADPVAQEFLFEEPANVPGYAGRLGLALAADLVNAIKEGRDPIIPAEAVVTTLAVIDAAYESWRLQRVVAPRG